MNWGEGAPRASRHNGFLAAVLLGALLPALGSWAQPSVPRPFGELGEPGPGADEEVRRLFRQSVALGVPEKDLARLMDASRQAGFTAGESQRVLRLVAGAKLAGLPHFDLLNKFREGLAKGAGPDAIQGALEQKAQSLRRAKGLVDALIMEGWDAPDYPMAVQMVSDALEVGAGSSDILRSVREGRPCAAGVPDLRAAFRGAGRGK